MRSLDSGTRVTGGSGLRCLLVSAVLLGSAISVAPAMAQPSDPYGNLDDRKVRAAQELIKRMQTSDMVLRSKSVGGFTWEARADLADPRTGTGVEGAAASLIGGTLYVSHGFRGSDGVLLSAYDTAADTWTHGGAGLPDGAVARSEMAGGSAMGNHYAIGGRTGPTDALEEFDPIAGTWASRAPMAGGPRGGMGAASAGGLIYVVGGRLGGTYGTPPILATHEVYNAATDAWTPLAPLPIAVSDNYATVALGGRVYVFGGVDGAGSTVATVQIYDVTSDTWSLGTDMPTARGAAMAGACGAQIAVFGGYDGSSTLATTEIYTPATDTWAAGPDMPLPANEIAQGVTYAGTEMYSVGTGIFGVSGMTVQRLICPAVSVVEIPTLDPIGIGLLILVLGALSVLGLLRRRRG